MTRTGWGTLSRCWWGWPGWTGGLGVHLPPESVSTMAWTGYPRSPERAPLTDTKYPPCLEEVLPFFCPIAFPGTGSCVTMGAMGDPAHLPPGEGGRLHGAQASRPDPQIHCYLMPQLHLTVPLPPKSMAGTARKTISIRVNVPVPQLSRRVPRCEGREAPIIHTPIILTVRQGNG